MKIYGIYYKSSIDYYSLERPSDKERHYMAVEVFLTRDELALHAVTYEHDEQSLLEALFSIGKRQEYERELKDTVIPSYNRLVDKLRSML